MTVLFRSACLVSAVAVGLAACGGKAAPAFVDRGSGGGHLATVASSSSGEGPGASTTASTTSSSSSQASSTSSGASSSGAFKEAAFPSPPQVVDYGGPVIASPQLHAIFFGGDDTTLTSSLGDFTTKIGSTSYWTSTVSEYGVGPATGDVIQLTETAQASLTDGDIQAWLTGKFSSDPTNFPAPSANDLYILYYPAGVTVTLQGMASCQTFGGYHNEASYNGMAVAYAVVPRCPPFGPGMTLLDVTTGDASHEIIEGCTDPNPQSHPAYTLVDDNDVSWADALGGSEVGDMCAQNPQAFTTFPGFPYVVQRTWSNKAAAAGHDPCQPEPAGEVYFNAAPVFNSMVPYSYYGQSVSVHGIKIPVGQSATIPVDFYSDGPVAAWQVHADDFNATFMGGSPYLKLSLTPTSGQNGTKGMLTITVQQAGPNNQELFFLASSNDGFATINWWFGAVGN